MVLKQFWAFLNTDIRDFFRKDISVSVNKTRSFTGARNSRLENDWFVNRTDINYELYSSLEILRNRSRDLERNDDYWRGAVTEIINNVIGEKIVYQSKVTNTRGDSLDEDLNSQIEKAFNDWMTTGNCDVTETHDFTSLTRLAFKTTILSGESLTIKRRVRSGESEIPFSLKLLEPDYLDTDYLSTSKASSNNDVFLGVEFNSDFKPVAYHILNDHPGGYFYRHSSTKRSRRVTARRVIHLFEKVRPEQLRGLPACYSFIQRLRDLSKYGEAELVAARASASIMGFRFSRDPDLFETDRSGAAVDKLEPGVIKELSPGEEFVGFDPTRPNSQYDPFVKSNLRAVAAGLGVDFESISKDYSDSNFSRARLSLIQARKNYSTWQHFLITKFLQPIFNEWLEIAVMSGVLDIPGYEFDKSKYRKGVWNLSAWGWVDPEKEVNAALSAISGGLSTVTAELRKKSLDIEDVLKERRNELDMANALGIDLTQPQSQPQSQTDSQSETQRLINSISEIDLIGVGNGNGNYRR